MATYKDDLDIIQAAEKDTNPMTLNAMTELDNKGLLGKYSGGGGTSEFEFVPISFQNNTGAGKDIGWVTDLSTRQNYSNAGHIPVGGGSHLNESQSITADVLVGSVLELSRSDLIVSGDLEYIPKDSEAKAVPLVDYYRVNGLGTVEWRNESVE